MDDGDWQGLAATPATVAEGIARAALTEELLPGEPSLHAARATTMTAKAVSRMPLLTRRHAAGYETASAFLTPFGPGHFG